MEEGRAVRTSLQLLQAGWFLDIVVCVVLILGSAIVTFVLTRAANENEINAANLRIVTLQNETQRLTGENKNQAVKMADLQTQIKNVQAKLDAITPSENTYNLTPNQSIIVGDGRLTLGLIGSPTNEGVNINVNGRPQSVAAGTVINSVLDPLTACQVRVQSFDMFKVVVTASCAPVKPQ
jgi:uncharacterized protein YlxW (UPF0749 family)